MKATLLFILLYVIGSHSYGQITGIVTDKSDGTPLLNVKIYASNGQRTLTDAEGKFQINITIVLYIFVYFIESRNRRLSHASFTNTELRS